MDNKIEIYKNEQFGEVRTTLIDGEPWFVAVDVCGALDIGNPSQAICKLDDDEKVTLTTNEGHSGKLGGAQMLNVVSEAGLYSLILRSRKPEAKVFKRWITHEVIPSIRKHGAYMTKSVLEQVMESPETVLMMAQRMLDEHRKNEELAKKLAVAQPKADYFDRFIDSGGCTNIRATAKELEIPERVFVSFLLDKRYLYRAPSGGLVPYAKSASDGLFVVKDFVARNGHQGVHTLVTTKDKELFYSLLGQMYC